MCSNNSLSSHPSSLTSDQPTRWLITGGCGFIGLTVIRQLLSDFPRVQIRVLDNLTGGTRDDLAQVCDFEEISLSSDSSLTTHLSPLTSHHSSLASHLSPLTSHNSVELCVGDITNPDTCLHAAKGMDVIVHLAANTGVQPSIADPVSDMRSNVQGTVNMLEAARKAKAQSFEHSSLTSHLSPLASIQAFVLASSGAPIGEAEPPLNEKAVCRPISPYGASKLAGEAYLSAYSGSFGMNTVALRFSNVYGPLSRRKGSVVAKFIRRALAGEPWVLNGGGEQTRDFIYAEDLARAVIKAADFRSGAELFQIATGKETSIKDLAYMLSPLLYEQTGRKPDMQTGPTLKGDVARNYADIAHARELLGWEPRVGLEEGLQRTVEWFCSS